MRRLLFHVPIIIAVLMSIGCAVHRVRLDPAPPVTIPQSFSISGGESGVPERWWETFNDDRLNALVASALDGNLTLMQAWDRIAQAQAQSMISGAGLWPQIDLKSSAERKQTGTKNAHSRNNIYALGLNASYEVDTWDRIHSQKNASNEDLNATRDDLEATVIVLVSQVAQTWYSIIEQQAQIQLLEEQLTLNRERLELLELRFKMGKATAVDVYQQRQQVSVIESRIPRARSRKDVLQHQLALLLGRSPQECDMTIPDVLPDLWPLPETGLPVDLLRRRPDVRAAERRVVAADYRLGAALADRYPRISLSASGTFQEQSVGDVFQNWLWNIGANLVQPIVDGKKRAAEVERNRAVVQERLHTYGQATLVAFREVEDALSQERYQKLLIDSLEERIEILENNLDVSQKRFINGQSDYLPVLQALSSLQNLQSEILIAKRELILFRIQLCEALGGTWTRESGPGISDSDETHK